MNFCVRVLFSPPQLPCHPSPMYTCSYSLFLALFSASSAAVCCAPPRPSFCTPSAYIYPRPPLAAVAAAAAASRHLSPPPHPPSHPPRTLRSTGCHSRAATMLRYLKTGPSETSLARFSTGRKTLSAIPLPRRSIYDVDRTHARRCYDLSYTLDFIRNRSLSFRCENNLCMCVFLCACVVNGTKREIRRGIICPSPLFVPTSQLPKRTSRQFRARLRLTGCGVLISIRAVGRGKHRQTRCT